jgi:hypothetical protein
MWTLRPVDVVSDASPHSLLGVVDISFAPVLALLVLAATGVLVMGLAGRGATSLGKSGTATRNEVRRSSGSRRLCARSSTLRPSLASPAPAALGYGIGASRGVECYCSVEDSAVVLGPPRSGKGIHLAIPMILDAPGAILATSTRPDNLTATIRRRAERGPVAVFDPRGLARGIPTATRWSPIRGCEEPHTAMVRAKALTSRTAAGTTDSNFWQASAEQVVRCLLHAAALGGRSCADLYKKIAL